MTNIQALKDLHLEAAGSLIYLQKCEGNPALQKVWRDTYENAISRIAMETLSGGEQQVETMLFIADHAIQILPNALS